MKYKLFSQLYNIKRYHFYKIVVDQLEKELAEERNRLANKELKGLTEDELREHIEEDRKYLQQIKHTEENFKRTAQEYRKAREEIEKRFDQKLQLSYHVFSLKSPLNAGQKTLCDLAVTNLSQILLDKEHFAPYNSY